MLLLGLEWFSLRENGTSYGFTLLMVSSQPILAIYSLATKSGGQDFLLKILKPSTSIHSLPSDLCYLLSEDSSRHPKFRSKDRSFLAFSIIFFFPSPKAINSWSFWKQFSFFVVWLWFYSCFFYFLVPHFCWLIPHLLPNQGAVWLISLAHIFVLIFDCLFHMRVLTPVDSWHLILLTYTSFTPASEILQFFLNQMGRRTILTYF